MSAVMTSDAEGRYDLSDLSELRLESVPFLIGMAYVGALALTTFALAFWLPLPVWMGGLLIALLVLAILPFRRISPTVAGFVLIGLLGLAWLAVLWLAPGLLPAALTLIVVGATSALFGPRLAFAAAGLLSVALIGSGARSWLSTADALAGVLLAWVGAGLFWLNARPAETALRWSWSSYYAAVRSRDEARRHRAELGQLLKTLDIAYRNLEQLNDELARARRVAEEARRLKAQFAASLSHELRTPLNLIIGLSEMMLDLPQSYGGAPIPRAYQVDLDAIHRNAQHLAGLVDDVLDLSQIEAGHLGLSRDRCRLAEIVDEAVKAVRPRFDGLGLSLTVEVPADLPAVFADRTRIRQILINLLNNAARFTDQGGVTIRGSVEGHDVLIAVADTGVGIGPEDLPHVFEEFYQTGGALQRRVGGNGLGLTISKRIVELHGGTMWVESTVGVGSTFFFTLPLADRVIAGVLSGEVRRPYHPAGDDRASLPTLAIIAGPETVARSFQRYLDGYRVVPVREIRDAARLGDERGISGLIVATTARADLTALLQQAAESGIDGPVVACTVVEPPVASEELRVDAYLTKPIRREQVKEVLRHFGSGLHQILVIDDNADMVRLLARMIQSLGRRYRVWQATSGREALALLAERQPDLIILDLLMPEVDGYAVLRAMRESNRLRAVPVVVISAGPPGADAPGVSLVQIGRPGLLSLSETISCVKGCFDALRQTPSDHSAPAPREARIDSPASAADRPRRGSAPAPPPERPNRPAPESPGSPRDSSAAEASPSHPARP